MYLVRWDTSGGEITNEVVVVTTYVDDIFVVRIVAFDVRSAQAFVRICLALFLCFAVSIPARTRSNNLDDDWAQLCMELCM